VRGWKPAAARVRVSCNLSENERTGTVGRSPMRGHGWIYRGELLAVLLVAWWGWLGSLQVGPSCMGGRQGEKVEGFVVEV
jgi:hypothetical protein